MKKILLLMLLLCCVSFAEWNIDEGDTKIIKSNSYCSAGEYSDTTESGGVQRWHRSCLINGQKFSDVYVVYYGSNKLKMKNKIDKSSKIYFQEGIPIHLVGLDYHYVEGTHYTSRVKVFTFDGTVTIK